MADEQEDLHDLTKLLLKRMESDPDEFIAAPGYKWRKAVETVREHGAKRDKDTLNAAIHKIAMDAGLQAALKTLMGEDGVPLRLPANAVSPGGGGGSGGPMTRTVTTRVLQQEAKNISEKLRQELDQLNQSMVIRL